MLSSLVYLLFVLAVLLHWSPYLKARIVCSGFALLFATLAGHILPVAYLSILFLAFFWWLWFSSPPPNKVVQALLFWGVTLFSLFIFLFPGRLPGFFNWLVFVDSIGASSVRYSLYANFDKVILGSILLLWAPFASNKGGKRVVSWTLFLWAVGVVLLLLPALPIRYIAFDPKFSFRGIVWLVTNAIFVCIPEECFFRGVLQTRLVEICKRHSRSSYWAIFLTSLIFASIHFRGGLVYIALSTIAGLVYGVSYLKTERIESPIFVHLAINATHFFCFSYPRL